MTRQFVLIITGDRHAKGREWDEVILTIMQAVNPTIIFHGGARGIDTIAGDIARAIDIPVEIFPAQWDRHGNAAGPIRNRVMIDRAMSLKRDHGYGVAVVAFHNDLKNSRGTRDMAKQATGRDLLVLNYGSDMRWHSTSWLKGE